ncbi:hypothetical protein KQI63_05535 [bacterium]|nr:hypothetical protein [bacterium]
MITGEFITPEPGELSQFDLAEMGDTDHQEELMVYNAYSEFPFSHSDKAQ